MRRKPSTSTSTESADFTTASTSTTPTSPPGNLVARFFKQFWYFLFRGSMIALTDLAKDVFIKPPKLDFEKMPKRTGQVAVMTGGSRGIGADILKKLLQLDYTVLLGVRSISMGEATVENIRTSSGVTSGKVKLFHLNLKSHRSVRQFASEVLACREGKRIDLLINNAGVMNVPYETTEDGYESHFQINYLSHFLLTNLLLPRIKETGSIKKKKNESECCQIVNTSSHAQKGGRIDFDELETSKVYSAVKCYFDSKLCQVIHVKTLERKFQEEGTNIHAYAVHPGEIPTDLWLELGFLTRVFLPVVKYACRTTDGAADTVLFPVFTPEIGKNQGGQYFESGNIKRTNPQASDLEIQNRLWDRSVELTSKHIIKNNNINNNNN